MSLIVSDEIDLITNYTFTNVLSNWKDYYRFDMPNIGAGGYRRNFSEFYQFSNGDLIYFYPVGTQLWQALRKNGSWTTKLVMNDTKVFATASFSGGEDLYSLVGFMDINSYTRSFNYYLLKYNSSDDTWSNVKTIETNVTSWDQGPKNVPYSELLRDGNNNLHIFYQEDGWYSYGAYLRERIYNTVDSSLSDIVDISVLSGNVDQNKNILVSVIKKSNNDIYALICDYTATNKMFSKKSAFGSYGTWTDFEPNWGNDRVQSTRYDTDENIHFILSSTDFKNLYYMNGKNGTEELITSMTSGRLDLGNMTLLSNGDIYVAWQEYIQNGSYTDIKIKAKAKRDGNWTDEILVYNAVNSLSGQQSPNNRYFSFTPYFANSTFPTLPSEAILSLVVADGCSLITNGCSNRKVKIVKLSLE
ncbi:MAG TPA: hypothetical protein PLO40_03005 [Spirochaetota bacterium]|nr:hypothetical protein [Spirochaetota bacterium]